MFNDKKGQVNSPFELLVAIIIMGFVVIIGSQMIANANDQVCLSGVENALQTYKSLLEETALNQASNKFEFRPNQTNCFNENKAIIKIQKLNNSKSCGIICGRATDSCFVITFNASDIANGFKQKCLNLPVYTSFVDDEENCSTAEPALDGYTAINPTKTEQNLLSGTYILRNVASAGKTYPVICTFWRR